MCSEDFSVNHRWRYPWWFLGRQRHIFSLTVCVSNILCALKISASGVELGFKDYFWDSRELVFFNGFTVRSSCCDVAAAQINYPSFKHNRQDSIEQARGRSHEEDSSQIFMLDDMQFGGFWTLFRLKQKKTENYQTKFNKIRKLSREQTLVTSTHPPTEIRTNHGNETSIYILNIYLFLTLIS